MPHPTLLDRSAFLRSALGAAFGLALGSASGCASAGEFRRGKVLLAYFSRPGENYYYGGRIDLKVGNTEVVARTIAKLIRCDVHRIEAANPYPHDYEQTVARNVREQEANARPRIRNPLCRGPRIGKGLAVQGEKARSSQPTVEAWLHRTGLLRR
jgi:hypothetical protein